MRHVAKIIFLLLSMVAVEMRAAHTTVELLSAVETVQPGATVLVGVRLEMEPGWHTYWKNPGESGQATAIKWKLPSGVTAGEIQWPVPEKLPPAEVTTYGYQEKTLLIVPLSIATNVPPGPLEITAVVSWLECNEACIPGSAGVQAELTVGHETKMSANAALIADWQKKLPAPLTNLVIQAWWEKAATGDTRPLIISWSLLHTLATNSLAPFAASDFYPAANDKFEIQPGMTNVSTTTATVQWRKQVKKFEGEWPEQISGLLVLGTGEARRGVDVKIPVGKNPAGENAATTAPAQPLWRMLIYAFIGGLILNIMPCVLPVIALKILGFVSEAKSSPQRVRALGGIYVIGVLFSFLVLAALVIGVKAAGHQAGWGMQFGSPVFLVCLVTLITLVSLNLFGVFEVALGSGAMNSAGHLAAKSGAAGAFFNGVLATILATPCTAPFLSIALGFAFAQSAAVVVLVFLTVGLGLASPYLLLSWNPAWLKFLPKPGAWMENFKIAMGFPMLATVVWLYDISYSFYGEQTWWLGIFLVTLATAAWIYGEFVQRGRTRKTAGAVVAAAVLVGGYLFALEKQLNWRAPISDANTVGVLNKSAGEIDWQPWSPDAVAKARMEGRPVFVDFTARWCSTCRVNALIAIDVASVRAKLKAMNAVTLLADYTRRPAEMTVEINHFNRPSVPLVLIYPKNPETPEIVLPEVLTPSIVLNALEQADKM